MKKRVFIILIFFSALVFTNCSKSYVTLQKVSRSGYYKLKENTKVGFVKIDAPYFGFESKRLNDTIFTLSNDVDRNNFGASSVLNYDKLKPYFNESESVIIMMRTIEYNESEEIEGAYKIQALRQNVKGVKNIKSKVEVQIFDNKDGELLYKNEIRLDQSYSELFSYRKEARKFIDSDSLKILYNTFKVETLGAYLIPSSYSRFLYKGGADFKMAAKYYKNGEVDKAKKLWEDIPLETIKEKMIKKANHNLAVYYESKHEYDKAIVHAKKGINEKYIEDLKELQQFYEK